MNAPSHITFRLVALTFAVLLGLQCVWLLLAEFPLPNLVGLPTEGQTAAGAAEKRGDATWAASIGSVRGDLWIQCAFTYADLLWDAPGTDPDSTHSLEHARATLDRAIDYAPHQSGAWVLLAGLASRVHWPNLDAAEALKMSYYTGPSEEALPALRLLVAARFQSLDDTELQELIRRDLRLLLAEQNTLAIVDAYRDASPAGRSFVKATIADIDPSSLGFLPPDAPKQ
jgi:hypothetical protein